MAKFQNRVHVYWVEDEGLPMVFDADGRGTEIYPTGTIECCFLFTLNYTICRSFFFVCGKVH